MNLDSIIFDLDGTLWNSTEVVLKAWNSILAANDKIKMQITRKDLESVMGLQAYQIGPKLFPELDEDSQIKLVKYCCDEENKLLIKQGGVLFPKVEWMLYTLSQRCPLFIVSNCECGYIETFLEYYKFGKYIKDIECAGNTHLVKGENIKLIIERNNLKNPVYVGDTQGDHDAAKLAQIPFVFASYGFGNTEGYDYILNEVADIVKLL